MDQVSLAKNIYDAILEDEPKKKNKNANCYLCAREYLPLWQGSAFCSEKCATTYDGGYPPYHDVRQSPEYHMFDKATKKGPFHIVAGPPEIKLGDMTLKVGDMYYDEKGIPVQFKKKEHSMKYLYDLLDALEVSKDRIRNDPRQGEVISGKYGDIWADTVYWHLYITARSKKYFSSLKKKLSFMELCSDRAIEGEFKLDRLPTSVEVLVIRKALGLKKKPGKLKRVRREKSITDNNRVNDILAGV